jgi:DNA-binding transcriptional LysR family regulator
MTEPTLTGLRVLREVTARGSLTATATALGYTQSAVSRQIAALEAAVGQRLLERSPRGVRLTEAGAILARHAAMVLDQLDAAQRDLAKHSHAGVERVRLGAFATATTVLVPAAIAALRIARPTADVTLAEGTTPRVLRGVAAGRIELAVVGAPTPDADVAAIDLEPLLDDRCSSRSREITGSRRRPSPLPATSRVSGGSSAAAIPPNGSSAHGRAATRRHESRSSPAAGRRSSASSPPGSASPSYPG